MRKLTAVVEENEIAMVIVQHMSTQIGGMVMGDPMTLSGGVAIRYGAMLIVDLRKRSIQETDPIKREDGMKIGVTVKKNHVVTDRNPYVKTEYFVIYGQGTEIYVEAIDLAIKQGILTKAGAFIRVPDENGDAKIINGEKMQWQGTAKFRAYCMDNPDFFENLKASIKGEIDFLSEEEVSEIKAIEEKDNEDIKEIEDVIETAKKAKKGEKTA